jgi:ethanolamine permease
MGTLVVLALGVFFCATGVAGWRAIVYPDPASTVASDSPLPLAMAHAVSESSFLYAMLVGIGLFGLVASFHGILLAAGRASMALGRADFAPRVLGRVDPRTGTPALALGANLVFGIAALLTGRTAQIITLSVFGALGLYVISMVALFALRAREPELPRPFRAVGYPFVPALALGLALAALVAMVAYNPELALVFAGLVGAGLIYFALAVRPKLRAHEAGE